MNVWALYEAYDLRTLRLSEVWIGHLAWHPSCSGHVRRAFIPSSPLSNLLFQECHIYIQSPFQIFNEFNLHSGISTNQPLFLKPMGFIVMTQSSSRITPYFSIHLSLLYIYICLFMLFQADLYALSVVIVSLRYECSNTIRETKKNRVSCSDLAKERPTA